MVHFVLKHADAIQSSALAAGVLAAAGKLGMVSALGLAVTACVLADCVRYEASRECGEKVLRIIHRVSPSSEANDRRSKKNQTWRSTQSTLKYANRTLLPGPPEEWPMECFELLLPKQLNIFCEINLRFRADVKVVS